MKENEKSVLANAAEPAPSDFIRDIVSAHLKEQRYQKVCTRFPPEPNGYLHIGHAKSICLNFGIAREFGGVCHLRMDDTNPAKEDLEYVQSIQEDVRWLIGGWAEHCLGLKAKGQIAAAQVVNGKSDFQIAPVNGELQSTAEPFYASDYFPQLYEYARQLISRGEAYVCDLSPEDTERYRGAPDKPGKDSPFRKRSVQENLTLFERMKQGEFADGERTLRAKIDMASPNIWLRDPVLYRIRHADHHHTGKQWCIYPMYDFAHCLSDYLEGITHSICTLEFEVHRPLYNWILERLQLPRPLPHQYEFARLNLSYTVMSKRKLRQLVSDKHVSGWNDPRMPTLCGLRRRGVPAAAVRKFAYHIGITKYNGRTEAAVLEHTIREELNSMAFRRLVVLRPLKVVLTNYPEGQVELLNAVNNPEQPSAGTRPVPFSRELYIERADFMESPPPNYFRLRPGGEVRLKYGYIIKCNDLIRDSAGEIVALNCTVDLESKIGGPTANRKIKTTIHWVSVAHAIEAEARLYDRLFTVAEPDALGDFRRRLNPRSLEVVTAKCEPSLERARPGQNYQFERLGYFCLDEDANEDRLVFNRTMTLRDPWSKALAKMEVKKINPSPRQTSVRRGL